MPIDGDNNFKDTNEIDEENKVEIEDIENEVGAEIQIIRPHVPIPNYSSYDNKTGLESVETADKSTYDNNFESAVTVSHEDNLRIKTVKELEETNIKDKQKIKELKAEQNTIENGKLVHEKKDKELINGKMIAEKNEFINTILTTENPLTEKIETEEENPERDKKIHKISKYLKNRKVEQNLEKNIEIKAIEDGVIEIIQDLPNQLDPSADHSSYDNKMGLESVNNSTYVDKSSIESADTVS